MQHGCPFQQSQQIGISSFHVGLRLRRLPEILKWKRLLECANTKAEKCRSKKKREGHAFPVKI